MPGATLTRPQGNANLGGNHAAGSIPAPTTTFDSGRTAESSPPLRGFSILNEPLESVQQRLLLHLTQQQVDKSIPAITLNKLPEGAHQWKEWLRTTYRQVSAIMENPCECRDWLEKVEEA